MGSAPLSPLERAERRQQSRRRERVRRVALVAVGLAAAGIAAAVLLPGRGGHHTAGSTDPPPATTRARAQPRRPLRTTTVIVERNASTLPAPVQDASGVTLRGRAVLLGGLTAADTSTDAVIVAGPAGSRAAGRLPTARHDTAAAALGRYAYVFGGGNGIAQLDEIVRVDAASGRTALAGRLPAASSDSSGAAVGDTAYVVGGYTGTRWLDTIVAWKPGAAARIVAHLPTALRYAAVAAANGRVVIAGGSLPDGSASSAVYEFTPGQGAVHRIGSLPAPTTHGAAAALGATVYVIGGRGATLNTPTDRIVAVDTRTGRISNAGALAFPLSDLTAVALGGKILVAGGRGSSGTVGSVGVLEAATTTLLPAVADVYAHDGANRLSPVARTARPLVYVPNSNSNTVDVVDPRTYRIVEHFAVGALPQHVVPAWDLRTLYVTNDVGNSLTPIDPRTGRPGKQIPVEDPYNMYFTPDGRHAIVVAERLHRLDFRNPHTFALQHSLSVPCAGVDHMDFSADGSFLLASCEFSGQMVKVDVRSERVVGTLTLPGHAVPQDVKLSADGRIFYVADMNAGGVWKVDGDGLRVLGFVHTGSGAHGLYPSRDSKDLYVTNRTAGTISVLSFRTRQVVATWAIPGGGSPDMGGVSADGKVLWVSGRYNAVLYAISTRNGALLAKIPVGLGPHGVCVWPQPGRYSLGHTGVLR